VTYVEENCVTAEVTYVEGNCVVREVASVDGREKLLVWLDSSVITSDVQVESIVDSLKLH
jgi:hypothetical protein